VELASHARHEREFVEYSISELSEQRTARDEARGHLVAALGLEFTVLVLVSSELLGK
jgi:hypothetical protein